MVATLGPDWWVKIADFGISKRVMAGGTELRTSVGTAAYMAPEVHGFLQGPAAYTKAVDIWAAGVIAFVVLAGKSPFDNAGALAAYVTQGIESSIERLKELPISNDGCELVQRCISIQPEARPGADEALRFGWFEHLQQSPRASSSITNVEAKVDLDAESVRASFELERADRETGTDFSATWNNARQESTPASSRQIDCEGSAAGIDMDVEPAGASFERDESNLGASTNVSPGIATHFAGSTTSIVPAPPAWRKRFPLDRSTTLTLSKPPTEPFLRIINISPQVQVGSLKFSQDQECLFTEFRNGDLRFWRVNDGKLASELNYFAASYRRWNGPQLFMVNTKKVIRFQTLLMNKARAARHDSRTFVGPPWKCVRTTDFGDITPLKLSHNGSFIVYGTADPQKTRLKIMVKDLELGTFLATLGSIPHHEHFRGAFSQNDEFLVARIDGQITVWNTRSWEVHAWSDFYSIYHTPLAVSSDGNLIPHVDNHNILYLWIVGKGVVASRFEHGENASVDEAEEARVVHEVQFSPDDRLLLVVRVNKTHEIWVGVWSVTSNELLRRIYLPNSSDLHHACAFSPDGSLFALATYGTIFICDVLHAIEKEPLRKNGTMNSEPFARNTPRDTKGALDMEEQALLLQKAQRSRHRVLQDANTARMTEVSKSAWKSLKNVFS
jgi:serine/threonine protein kinase